MNERRAVWGWVAALALLGCGGASSGQSEGAATTEQGPGTSGGERPAEATTTPPPAPAPAPATVATPAPPPAPAPPAAPRVNFPRYTEIQAYLRGSARGERCFQNNIIQADLTDAYVDGDFDGDGAAERVFQTPDCLVVAAQRGERWEVSAIAPRSVGRDVESVRLRAGSLGGRSVIDATDLRGTQRATSRWRYTGSAIESLP